MKKLTIVLDNVGHKELKDYLLTLKGIKEVEVNHDHMLEINVTYDEKETNPAVIKTEIVLFLDIAKSVCMYTFDKHETNTKKYHTVKPTVCCEYCFHGFIEELYDIDGIIKAKSNFKDFYFNESDKDLTIDIEYDPNKLAEEDVKKLVDDLSE